MMRRREHTASWQDWRAQGAEATPHWAPAGPMRAVPTAPAPGNRNAKGRVYGDRSMAVLRLAYRGAHERLFTVMRRRTMSKGMDRKKEAKKKPAKSPQEKRAAKREKKQNRGFQV